jgi:DNA adenine methylase Dam
MGNKERLIKKGLIELFPNNINTFIDLFCGSGVVSLNVNAKNKILIDNDINIIDLINYFKNNNPNNVIKDVEEIIKNYQLPTFSTDARKFKGDRNIFKEKYNILKNDYNNSRSIKLLYVLNIFSNSHMLRFNSRGEFNMPFGNGYFTDKCKENILNNTYNELTTLINSDFRDINIDLLKKDDFIYLDPPYLNTDATYNENKGWSINDENDLYKICEKLNNKGIKFGLSNVFQNKGIENKEIIQWCEDNDWNIYLFDKFTYCACGKGNADSKEVFITNYTK